MNDRTVCGAKRSRPFGMLAQWCYMASSRYRRAPLRNEETNRADAAVWLREAEQIR